MKFRRLVNLLPQFSFDGLLIQNGRYVCQLDSLFIRCVVCMQLLESMLGKLVDEFENRLKSQNELVCSVSFSLYLSLVFGILLRCACNWQRDNQNQSIGTGESCSEKWYRQHQMLLQI